MKKKRFPPLLTNIIRHSHSSSPPARCKLTTRSLAPYKQSNQQTSPAKQKRKQLKYKSIISDLFDGKLLSSVQCLTCNKVSTRIETFQDLSLPIPSRDHVTMLHQGSIAPQSISTCSDVYKGKPVSFFLSNIFLSNLKNMYNL